ncbi:hypothetical protein DCAR_0101115 [Daucus carota subsp. sativus]|uniref:Ubiquitin-like protease family profile domain-containing protein n=1 Tax=Daucus carota subsp. sativus TaxID=79200 RepID=A0A166G5C8_DAUCS|nr:hypothetical protein DCAR_0101115 [Daucus carota subsp. sativus]
MARFETNLQDLEVVYNRCLTNFIDSLALFPQNRKLSELKKRYKLFFKMFGESSPVTKSLSNTTAQMGVKAAAGVEGVVSEPSFSLGLSQLFPKNLGRDMESCEKTPQLVTHARNLVSEDSVLPAEDRPAKIRPRRGMLPSASCRSPYVTRVTDISNHTLTSEEKDVWNWLCKDKSNEKEHIFAWRDRGCTKAHFHSLEDNQLVESTVIDTWTHMLNESEILRSAASPLRLFLTSETTYGPLLMDGSDTDRRLDRYMAFDDNMDVVMNMVNEVHNKRYDISDFDMFYFPIFTGAHHFIVCYNIKKPSWEIIDNRVQTMSIEDTYGDLLPRLHDLFIHFLLCNRPPKYSEIVNLKPQVLKMSWQTVDNSVDCGVFVMRHLESYMGNPMSWKSGLRTEVENQKSVLHKLRVIYAHRMLTWSQNKKRHRVLNYLVKFSMSKLQQK